MKICKIDGCEEPRHKKTGFCYLHYKEYRKQWNKNHTEERKQYRKDHTEEIKQYNKQYYKNHIEEIKQYGKQYYKDHIEERKQYDNQYYKDHIEEIKQYRKDNPEVDLKYKQKKLEKLGNLFDISSEQYKYALMSWSKTVKKLGFGCGCCRSYEGKFHSHHIFPKIKYPEKSLDVNNGMVLCITCHIELHRIKGTL